MRRLWQQTRNGVAALAPGRFPYRRFALALAIGCAGGWGFNALKLPLPWILGPMTTCTLAALLRLPVSAPPVIRPPMTVVLGVMLGTAFRPDLLHQMQQWLPAFVGLILFMIASALACIVYFRAVGHFDPVTAFFAGMPGGLVEMVTVGEEKGGDGKVISLVHSARILLVVMGLPFVIQHLAGVELGGRRPVGLSLMETPLASDLWLVFCGISGMVVAHLIGMPSKFLLGPMFATAFVHVMGFATFAPPMEILIAAQLVLGTTIGCRFVGTPPREILRVLGLSLGSTLILLVLTALFSFSVSRVTDFEIVPLMLAYSPGGLAEMSLVALALHIEVAFVAAHHVARVFIIMLGAGPLFTLMGRGDKAE